MDAVLRLGLIGAANIAWRRTLPALGAAPDVRLTAVGSRDPRRAARFTDRFGGRPYGDYPAVLAAPDVDAVYIPLPAALHAPWVRAALLAGKHVLVEKPLATNLTDAHELVTLAAERGLVLLENFAFLLHRQHATVRRLLDGGAIGTVRSVHAEFGIPPLPRTDIRYQPELGGGALLDLGVYPLRVAQALLGPELTVLGAHLRADPDTGLDLAGSVLLGTPAGATAQLSFGLDTHYRAGYGVWGSTGWLGLRRPFAPPPEQGSLLRLERGTTVRERQLAPDDHFGRLLRNFATAVRTGAGRESFGPAILRQAALVDAVRRVAAGTGADQYALSAG